MVDDSEIGYGKPPKNTRFQKGRSGNPQGRPRQAPSFKADLAAELQQTLAVTENGKQLTVTKQQAILKMLTTAALKDVRAASVLLDVARKLGVGAENETSEHGSSEDDAALLDDYIQRERAAHSSPKPKTETSEGDENDR